MRLALALIVTVALAGCNDSGESSSPSSSSSTTTKAAAPHTSGFLAWGDFGTGAYQDDVAEAMERWAAGHPVDALVTTGDNVYREGNPDLFEEALDEPYERLRRHRPFWVTLGNHDVQAGYGDRQLDHLGLPDLPYTRRLPGVQLLFLDGNRPDAEQEAWLARKLRRDGPRFRVVVFHQPPYSCGHYAPGTFTSAWVDTFEKFEVAMVLTGHDHNYQRFRSDRDVSYVVTGGGGYSLYPLTEPCDLAVADEASASRYHFVHVRVRGGRMVVRAVGLDGTVFDRFVVRR